MTWILVPPQPPTQCVTLGTPRPSKAPSSPGTLESHVPSPGSLAPKHPRLPSDAPPYLLQDECPLIPLKPPYSHWAPRGSQKSLSHPRAFGSPSYPFTHILQEVLGWGWASWGAAEPRGQGFIGTVCWLPHSPAAPRANDSTSLSFSLASTDPLTESASRVAMRAARTKCPARAKSSLRCRF